MPRLPSAAAEQAKKAQEEGPSFAVIDEGTYVARLVEVKAGTSKQLNPKWVWTYEILAEPYIGRKLNVHTALTDAAMWKVAEQFSAFGASTDTDTDELVGQKCRIAVSQGEITSGASAGQVGNNVDRTLPLEDAPATAGAAAPAAGSDSSAEPATAGANPEPGW